MTDLRNDTVDVKPIDYDFGQGYDPDGETGWTTVQPDFSKLSVAEFAALAESVGNDYETRFDDLAEALEESDPDWLSPVMNYAYPLPGLDITPEHAQALLLDTSLCVVMIDGDPYMALQGGGMDFSWDICAAYVTLGLLPPAHFAGQLPDQGDIRVGAVLNACVWACEMSCRGAEQRVERIIRQADKARD